ncbi:hypothetical protein EV363DRAFT_1434674 [Boletus edulis]|nr:hypothetical protein EV363DRAFT_1434674 [Boletus edulis]
MRQAVGTRRLYWDAALLRRRAHSMFLGFANQAFSPLYGRAWRQLATDHILTLYPSSQPMSIVKGAALVTGSAHGIGRGIVFRLARDWFILPPNDASSQRNQLRAVTNDIEKIC